MSRTMIRPACALLLLMLLPPAPAPAATTTSADLFARDNLVAWCIVPFDARKRAPEARAEMLARLGFKHFAYDWRTEHIPTFDEEIQTLKRWNIELTAFWFPGAINDEAKAILDALKRNQVQTELWVSMHGGDIQCSPDEHRLRVEQHVATLRPIVEAAAAIGCKVGLYNHGGWFGEPENQIEILKALDAPNVGLVYNLHHGHAHLDRFQSLLNAMKPYLYCLNLNGMTPKGDEIGKKILPLGTGERDLEILRIIRDSGYTGHIGILGHTDDDAERTLRNNLDGLDWLLPQLDGAPPIAPRPPLHTADMDEIENPAARAALPEFQIIPAANPETLAPTIRPPHRYFTTWTRSHGDPHNTRYADFKQINPENVAQLTVAWEYHSGDGPANIQCNPIVVEDTIYAPTSGGHIVALDTATGHERWRFKPGGTPAMRGLLYWPGGTSKAARLFFGSGDYLYALDPRNGRPIAHFGENGRIRSGEVRVAPAVYESTLIVPAYARDIHAYDALSGEHRWTFHTIPHDGEFARDTWDEPEEGANCWGGMALDEDRGIAYIATGSPKPNFAGNTHRGQNLFANCVIALDARTGNRLWHFQEIRHDIWDWDIPAPPNLVSVTRHGRRVDAVAQVTKLGNTLLLDRLTGQPLFPFRMRRAPVSPLPGERTWPYQPDLELPQPFARQAFSLADLTARSPEARNHVLHTIANARYGRFETFEENRPTVLYNIHGGAEWTGAAVDPHRGLLYVSANNIPWIITVFRPDPDTRAPDTPPSRGETLYQTHCAHCHGPTRLGSGTYPPLHGLAQRTNDDAVRQLLQTGRRLMPPAPSMKEEDTQALLDFLFLRDRPQTLPPPSPSPGQRTRYTHNGYPKLLDHEGYPGVIPPWGTLNCINLNTGRIQWQVPLGHYPELAEWGETGTGAENFGGPSLTAGGLVFCAGTPDQLIRAFDAETGKVLWQHPLPAGGYAPPTIYMHQRKQYILIAATGGGKLGTPTGDAYIAFALPRENRQMTDSACTSTP